MIDRLHALSALTGLGSLVGGVYLIAGCGAALCTFGLLLLSGVVYARTRAIELRKQE